ncbi:MAG: hypothetical protein H6722_33405 [Sandaracinus sp.]|nr:hypothetical protein [Sandaracinus sp.]MCB9617356.1 hypothetical protein [Sandaracinus sp.]
MLRATALRHRASRHGGRDRDGASRHRFAPEAETETALRAIATDIVAATDTATATDTVAVTDIVAATDTATVTDTVTATDTVAATDVGLPPRPSPLRTRAC